MDKDFKKCPVCGTTSPKKFRVLREGKRIRASCHCGYLYDSQINMDKAFLFK